MIGLKKDEAFSKEYIIGIFKRQIDKLNDDKYRKNEVWVNHTAELVKRYIGENTHQHNFICGFRFEYQFPSADKAYYKYYRVKVDEGIHFIESCIDFIETNGLYKPPSPKKSNFLGEFDNQTLWVIIPIFIGAIITGSFWVGKYSEKMESFSTPAVSEAPKSPNEHSKQKNDYQRQDSIEKNRNGYHKH